MAWITPRGSEPGELGFLVLSTLGQDPCIPAVRQALSEDTPTEAQPHLGIVMLLPHAGKPACRRVSVAEGG